MRTALQDEIKSGATTDIYFTRTRQILEALGVHKRVTADVKATSLPAGYEWAVVSGMYDALGLLDGVEVDAEAVDEGTIIRAGDPVMQITGDYLQFCVLETAILGYLCQQSGVATKAARCKAAAGDRQVVSFGARRMHPALSPIIERNAYIGGCDGVSTVLAADLLGIPASGTMPHALILMLGSVEEAVRSFDQIIDPDVPRIALVDTLCDEKFESLAAAEAIGDRLAGVRLDTPGSRRGNMTKILDEVRWELDLRGFQHVKLYVSGGLDECDIAELNAHCDGYGVGTAISNARTIDFALDIVEIEGKPLAKRGKLSGRKQLLRCPDCLDTLLVAYSHSYPKDQLQCPCGNTRYEVLKTAVQSGRLVKPERSPAELRDHVREQLTVLMADS